jgi:deoxyribose-phosphate aldolase
MRNFNELFNGYSFHLNETQVKENVKNLIDTLYENTDRPGNIKDLFSHIEITSLSTTDNEEKIVKLVEKINALDEEFPEMGKPAAICVYPAWVELVKNTLTEDINITTVVGFPSAQTFIETKVAETGLSLLAGANEIDMVLSVGKFLQGNYEEVFEEIQEIKASCRGAKLKVILEAGLYPTPQDLYKASILAMEAGADYIKTSTGKDAVASLYNAYVMCQAIHDFHAKTGVKAGFKAAGGIVTTQDALLYLTVVKDVLGEDWVNTTDFRIGASRLANNILSAVRQEEVSYF